MGINETKTLKYLNKINFALDYNMLFNYCKETNPSISHHSTLGALLHRLKRKQLISITEDRWIKITKKGMLMLEVIKVD